MGNWKNEEEARAQIKELVSEYYHDFKEKKEKITSLPSFYGLGTGTAASVSDLTNNSTCTDRGSRVSRTLRGCAP